MTTRALVPIPRTAIVPAAGLGTRFLPATKTVPKELLPVVDTPGIELVAAEAAEAGAERLIIVTSEGKDSVVAHFVGHARWQLQPRAVFVDRRAECEVDEPARLPVDPRPDRPLHAGRRRARHGV